VVRDLWLPRSGNAAQLPRHHQMAADIETVVATKAAIGETQAVPRWRPLFFRTVRI
jgi:hypothetical protein